MLTPFQWSGNTGGIKSPEAVERERKLAEALLAPKGVAQNGWEGLSQLTAALSGTALQNQATEGEAAGQARAAALLSGLGSGTNPDAIIAALSSPDAAWLTQGQSGIASALLGRGWDQADEREDRSYAASVLADQRSYEQPMRDIELQTAQTELEALQNPQAAGAEYFGQTLPWKDAAGNLQYYQLQKGQGLPTLPPGATWLEPTSTVNTGTAQTVIGRNTGAPVAAIPIQNEQAAFDSATGKGLGEANVAGITGAPQAIAGADTMLSQIDAVLNDPNLGQAVGLGGILPAIPNTDQAGVVTRIEQLQGQAFLQAFESLKGAGQITEVEGAKATAAIARLNRAQNLTDFRTALGELRDIVAGAQQRAAAKGGVTLAPPAPTPPPPPVPQQSQANPAVIDWTDL